METLQKIKQQLLFYYFTSVANKKKEYVIGLSAILLILSSLLASHVIKTNDSFSLFTDAKSTLSQDELLESKPAGLTTDLNAKKAPPTPTDQPLDSEELQLLTRALEATWKRINALQDSPIKTSLNDQAAAIASLLKNGNADNAQLLLSVLILTTDEAEFNNNLTLTPSPSPTASPTITPSPTPPYAPDGTSYSTRTISTERGSFSIKEITIDITKYNMLTETADDANCANNCTTKSLAAYIKENDAVAGINGTYFCPPDYAECASKKNSFDFPVYNSRVGKWINPYNLLWNDRAIIFQDERGLQFRNSTKSVKEYEYYYEYEGTTRRLQTKKYIYYAGFAMAPGLLEGGNVIVDQYPLTEKQKAKGLKAGLGFNENTIYVVLAYNVSMVNFGYVFKAIGATYAINLDAGGSTAMWYGNYKAGPGRSLPNAIVFVKK